MNSIVVHEFEKLNEEDLKSKMKNIGIFKYANEFSQLIDFINEFNATEENADSYDILSVKKDREKGLYITFKNYVGLIQLKSGFQLEVLPKVDIASSDKDIKKIFVKMLCSMKEFSSKVFNTANLNIDKMNLYEIFINMYLKEVFWLTKKGLKSSYVLNNDNLNVCKGKLILKEQLKENLVHKEKFYVSYDEYSINRPENKLIKSTLIKLFELSINDTNKKMCAQLIKCFENVEPSDNYDFDFSKVVIDRNTKIYENVISWSKVFLKKKSFTTFSGNSVSRALLFPMEKVFEAYIAKYVKKIFDDCDVRIQDTGYYLFSSPLKKFALRPDLVVTKSDGTLVILDTKWKRLFNNPKKNYGISQSDMYQMYAYSKKYKTPYVWLLYPLNSEMLECDPISFISEDNVNVNIFFVDILNIESSLMLLKSKI